MNLWQIYGSGTCVTTYKPLGLERERKRGGEGEGENQSSSVEPLGIKPDGEIVFSRVKLIKSGASNRPGDFVPQVRARTCPWFFTKWHL